MKTLPQKPGFELIFSLSLIIILGLPPVLLAQTTKDLEIKIENGDTTINGKNIKQLSAADRDAALADINHINSTPDGHVHKRFFFRRQDTVSVMHRRGGMRPPMISQNREFHDSSMNRPGRMEMRMALKRRMDDDMAPPAPFGDRMRGQMMMNRMDRRNTQNFDYVNTNNDGVSTHVRFHVSEANDDDLKRMPYVEGPKFEIKDLNIIPEFSTGKTLLMFNLLSKAPAEVKLSDSEGKLLWSEKTTNGNFNKSFVLGLNGIYYLQIKQGSSFALRKIMKEE